MTEKDILEVVKVILQPTMLLSFTGLLVSLLTSYIPGFREWYAVLKPVQKALGQVVIITVIIICVGILSFTKVLAIVPANTLGVMLLVISWFSTIVTNQTTYLITKNATVTSVLEAKESNQKSE
jgi:hypothetical protein